ncbi:flagellar hook-basal body complex protein FliE [Legionella sp. CNM-4043-24]|uniref:flagellar hook-basal body complex protein FliE n=1 Tax=Legionella sp. CNM-4043-24 TaxID=3421646 RepID=UPI00403B124D
MTMTSSAISKVDISATLEKIRALTGQGKVSGQSELTSTKVSSFDQIMSVAKNALSDINNAQFQTEALKKSYLSGDPTVSISQVMMSTMKSKLAFEGLLVVRNKLLESYKEIMNMPV